MISTSQIQPEKAPFAALFVDIGGVLLTNGWDRRARQRAAQTFRLDYEDLDERHHLTFDTYEEGKLSLDEYLNRVIFHKERSFSREEFRSFMFAQSKPYPDMLYFVKQIKEKYGLKVIAISNEGRELTVHRIQTFQLDRIIDYFISSCFVHYRKPDTDIYRMALDAAQVSPSQVVYLDDRELFVEVACSLGIRGIPHRNLEDTRKALKSLGLSIYD